MNQYSDQKCPACGDWLEIQWVETWCGPGLETKHITAVAHCINCGNDYTWEILPNNQIQDFRKFFFG